jgi:C1A family cysteine protease
MMKSLHKILWNICLILTVLFSFISASAVTLPDDQDFQGTQLELLLGTTSPEVIYESVQTGTVTEQEPIKDVLTTPPDDSENSSSMLPEPESIAETGGSIFHPAPINQNLINYYDQIRSPSGDPQKIKGTGGIPEIATFGTDTNPTKPLSKEEKQKLKDEYVDVEKDFDPSTAYPASFDARTKGWITPVKDQGNCGSCWAFAAFSSMESYSMPAEFWDFSEQNLKNLGGWAWTPCEGGNAAIATAYLARGSGPVTEADDPYYDDEAHPSPSGLPKQKLLLRVDRFGNDRNIIKSYVYSMGAVDTSIYFYPYSTSYYNSATSSYYYPPSGSAATNHDVTIVGWDDNFPATNFGTTPSGNGAWLIKNSWGTSFGSGGYFWISYYDKHVGDENAFFAYSANPTYYKNIYQYDPLGRVISMGTGDGDDWAAAIFTASSDEILSRVTTYIPADNAVLTVKIYKGVSAGDPDSGTLAYTASNTFSRGGYNSFSVGSIPLTNGEKFSVVFRYQSAITNSVIPIEMNYWDSINGWYVDGATTAPGRSYLSDNGVSWDDASTLNLLTTITNENPDVCIKAITINKESTMLLFRPSDSTFYVDVNGNTAWSTPPADGYYSFGTSTDIPVVYNWNTGKPSAMAAFRSGTWYVDWNYNFKWDGTGAGQDQAFTFGKAGDYPILGNWPRTASGNLNQMGVFRNGYWYVDYNGNYKWDATDRTYHFGKTGDIPVVNNWDRDGSGTFEIGVFRNGYWYVDYNGNNVWDAGDRTYHFGMTGDRPVIGDWSGNGIYRIGVFRNGYWYVDYNGNNVWDAGDRTYHFGKAGDYPFTAKW